MKQFHSLMMKEGESVKKYIQHFKSVRARMSSCGTNLSEMEAAEAFLASLPGSYSASVTAQTGLLDLSKAALALGMGRPVSLSDVIASLLAEELKRDSQRRHGASSSGSAKALYSAKNRQKRGKKPYSSPTHPTQASSSFTNKRGPAIGIAFLVTLRRNAERRPLGSPDAQLQFRPM